MKYSIKEVSEKTGFSAHTLRYYEREGLLRDINRTKGRIRYYTDDDLDVLGLICCLKKTGMPLSQIAHFVSLAHEGDGTLRERCDILCAHREHVLEQMQEMRRQLDKVTWKIDFFARKLDEHEALDDGRS